MERLSPFKLLTDHKRDPYIESQRIFSLFPHQTIPKYVLLGGDDDKLGLFYAMGTGKTATATFTLLKYLNHQFFQEWNALFTTQEPPKSNITIVAGWQSKLQFENELFTRPEFGFVSQEQYNNYNKLIKSSVQAERETALKIREKLVSKLNSYIRFIGYQGFFNLLFPNNSSSSYQNIEYLISEYEKGTLLIEP